MNRHVAPNSKRAMRTAKRNVEQAERALAGRLEAAGVAGHATIEQAVSLVRPLMIGAVAIGGLVWLVSALRRPRRRGFVRPDQRRPSLVNEALRAAGVSLASAAARRLGEHLLAAADETPTTPAGRAAPARE